jgi:hypothetical protein
MGHRLFFPLNSLYLWRNSFRTLKENLTIWSKGFIKWWRCSKIREQVMNRAYSHQQKIKQAFDRRVRKKSLSWVIWCSSGMHPGRIEANTISLMPSGLGLSESLKYSQTTLTGCRIWKAKKFLMAQ